MKTILHITECLGSGVLYYVKNLCAWQVKDYRVVVAYSTRPETPADFRKQFDEKVEFIKVNGFTREIRPKDDLKAFLDVKRIVKKVKPDLIHLHSTKAGVIGRWAIDSNKYRILYSPHAYSFLMENCSEQKRAFYKFIEKISDRKRVITIADIDSELEASKGVAKTAICIPNGINCNEMDQITDEAEKLIKRGQITSSKAKTVCMIGKVVYQKNPALFNEVAKRMRDIHFVWIGGGPLENELNSDNVEITGWVSRPEAVARIMMSDILVFTSKWESLSIALLEAMYVGKMCIVSDVDGNRDVVKNGVNGFVCSKVDEYVKHIESAFENPQIIMEMGANSRKSIIETYNVNAMEKAYRRLFKDLDIGIEVENAY